MSAEKQMDERQKQLYYRYHYHAFYMLAGLCIILAVLWLQKLIPISEGNFAYFILFSPLLPCGYLFFREAKSQLLTQRECKQNFLFSVLWLALIVSSNQTMWLRIVTLLYCVCFVGVNIWAFCRLKKTAGEEEKELVRVSCGDKEKYCAEWKETKAFLKECCHRGRPQEIVLQGVETTQYLKLLYTDKGVCVQFFEDEEKHGFQAFTKGRGKGTVGYEKGIKTFFPSSALLSFHQAISCAKSFFTTKSLPDKGEWHEI